MEHVVFFPASDATPAFRRVSSLEEAVRLVEHLRNVEGVPQVSVHALNEVPLSFRTVIKVELPGVAAQPPAQAAPVTAPAPEQAAQAAPEPVAEAGPPVEAELPPASVPVQPAAAEAQDELEPFDVPAVEGMDQLSAAGGRARSLGFFA